MAGEWDANGRLITYHGSALGYVRAVNRMFRANDESHKWPINGRFNVTERAIRRLRRAQADGLVADDYEAALEAEISAIVNDERNW